MNADDPDAERGSRRGPNDPGRRDRIIDACLDVIAEVGVEGATHRRIAEAAAVPLGSMTYYFTGMQQLLQEAFTRFATEFSGRFEHRMAAAGDLEEARAAVVAIVTEDVFADQRELVLTQELYTLAARAPEYRELTHAWMGRSRDALARHFDPVTVRMLDALIEGLGIHRALDVEPQERALVAEAVLRITTPPGPNGDEPRTAVAEQPAP